MTNRRGNGLLAESYVPLILLPPASADRMLEALGAHGIAAYAVRLDADTLGAEAAAGGAPAGEGARDHLYVDEGARDAAELVLRSELPDLAGGATATAERDDAAPARPEADGPGRAAGGAAGAGAAESGAAGPESADTGTDAVWDDLVARFYSTDSDAAAPAWPDAENVGPGSGDRAGDPAEEPADDSGPGPGPRTVRPAADGDSADDGGHFVPPPPPPLPRGDLTSRLAWGGLFGGPLFLLGSMLLDVAPGWPAFLAVAAFIAGFVVLVVRMGDRASGDNGPDDGAVV
ncbi:hypothetical protein [Nocardiopsis coralliicola]